MARRKKVDGIQITVNVNENVHVIEHSLEIPTFMITAEVGRALERLIRETEVGEVSTDGNDAVSAGNTSTVSVVSDSGREDEEGSEVTGDEGNDGASEPDTK